MMDQGRGTNAREEGDKMSFPCGPPRMGQGQRQGSMQENESELSGLKY